MLFFILNLSAAVWSVQAGLIPRIFAYLFHRIEQIQNEQVNPCTLQVSHKPACHVMQMCTESVHGPFCRCSASQVSQRQLASSNELLDDA